MSRFTLPETISVSHPSIGAEDTVPGLINSDRLMAETERSFPFRIGPYLATRILGHGGMGVVYLAERADAQLQQQVALKVLPVWAQTEDRERFLQERQIPTCTSGFRPGGR